MIGPSHPALSPAVRKDLDGFLFETIAELREMLANVDPAVREGFSRLPPEAQKEWLSTAIREALWDYKTPLHARLALVAIEAGEKAAIDAYVEGILGPVRRAASRETIVEELWKTLALRLKPETAIELGYQPEPSRGLDRLTRDIRKTVKREAWKHENQFGRRRRDHDELGALDEEISEKARRAVGRGEKHEGKWRPQPDTVSLDEERHAALERIGDEVGEKEVTDEITARALVRPARPEELLLAREQDAAKKRRGEGVLAQMYEVAKKPEEHEYARLLATTDLNQSEAAREVGLTLGQAKAFRERAARHLKKNRK